MGLLGAVRKGNKNRTLNVLCISDCFISFSATPICFGNAAQFSQKKKRAQTFKSDSWVSILGQHSRTLLGW